MKNKILNSVAFSYLLEDQNAENNQVFMKRFNELCTDKEILDEINKIAISTHTTCGQLPTSITHTSSTMTPFAAILHAFEALSDLSRIPLLPNTFGYP